MTRKTILSWLLLMTIGTSGIGQAASRAHPPRMGIARAQAIALKAAPGKIMSAEYEKEAGAWRYSFDIQQRGHVQEIGVDARTGRIVENKSEGKVDRD